MRRILLYMSVVADDLRNERIHVDRTWEGEFIIELRSLVWSKYLHWLRDDILLFNVQAMILSFVFILYSSRHSNTFYSILYKVWVIVFKVIVLENKFSCL